LSWRPGPAPQAQARALGLLASGAVSVTDLAKDRFPPGQFTTGLATTIGGEAIKANHRAVTQAPARCVTEAVARALVTEAPAIAASREAVHRTAAATNAAGRITRERKPARRTLFTATAYPASDADRITAISAVHVQVELAVRN